MFYIHAYHIAKLHKKNDDKTYLLCTHETNFKSFETWEYL